MGVNNLISSVEYNDWVANWNALQASDEFSSLFIDKLGPQTGMLFDFDSLYYLFSTTGIATVKIRFGVDQPATDQSPAFHLVLFGADNDNQVVTPYFISQQYTYGQPDSPTSNQEGNLPRILMEKWEACWYNNLTKKDVGQQLFNFRYGYLQGYNYPITEIMDALGAFQGASTINIKYGLHEYYPLYPTPAVDLTPICTFGLVLYASTEDGDGSATVIKESGYYDLTAPCPHTC